MIQTLMNIAKARLMSKVLGPSAGRSGGNRFSRRLSWPEGLQDDGQAPGPVGLRARGKI